MVGASVPASVAPSIGVFITQRESTHENPAPQSAEVSQWGSAGPEQSQPERSRSEQAKSRRRGMPITLARAGRLV